MNRFRIVLGALGIGLGAVGALRDDRRLVWVAIAAVGSALVLRLIERARGAPSPP